MTNSMQRWLPLALMLALPWPAQAFTLDFGKIKDTVQNLSTAVRDVSEEDEIELGKGVSAVLLGAAPLVDDAALQTYVNQIGKWLALRSERPKLPWRFGVLDDNGVNAFATPGGNIFITRGLLLRMRDEAELAGVLAHEISHVVERHALKTMKKGAWAGLAGNVASFYAEKRGKEEYGRAVSGFTTEVYTRGLDKDDEYAADRAGVVLAARAGYDPYGLATVLQMLASIGPQDDAVALMFKTHPDSGERLEKVTFLMDGRLDTLADQPRLADRFARVMEAHLARAQPAKP